LHQDFSDMNVRFRTNWRPFAALPVHAKNTVIIDARARSAGRQALMKDSAFSLTREEVDRFHLDGFLGPYPVRSREEMPALCDTLFSEIFPTDGPNPRDRTHSRHLDTRELFELVSAPAIVGRIASLLGPDLMVWTTGFFIKQPFGGSETPWHQDINYWPLEPQVNVTVWIAIEDIAADSSPLHVIPGSHRKMLPHVPVAGKAFEEEADPALVDTSRATPLLIRAGEFVMFSERLLHHAPKNLSARRRTALAARYTTPMVRLFPDEPPINFPGYHAILVSGADRFGRNPLGAPPKARAARPLAATA
jgi:hypothetical protein